MLSNKELELFFLGIKEDGYNGVCCFNSPLISVFLDQNEFPYILISSNYMYDFLDHFKEMNFSKRKFSNKKFDLAVINIDEIGIYPSNIKKVLSPPYMPSPKKILMYSSSGKTSTLLHSKNICRDSSKYSTIITSHELFTYEK